MITKNKEVLHIRAKETPNSDVRYLRGVLNKEIQQLSGKLQGLAACQVGQPYRMFAMRDPKTMEFEYVVNPKVLFKFGIMFKDEGCLSEDGRYIVCRPLCSVVRYQTVEGETVTKFLWRKRTRIFMHEYDHLNGITLTDKKVSIKVW